MEKNKLIQSAEASAHAIVGKMLDWGHIESVPEAESIEYEIAEIIKEKFRNFAKDCI